MAKRTIKVIERVNGEVVRDEEIPASVDFDRTRRGTLDVRYENRTHREAFAAIAKAHGGKWWPGTRTWEIPADKAAAVLTALAADGFEVDAKRAKWLGLAI